MSTRSRQNPHKHRHGLHHRQNKRYLKTYLPYLPVVASILASLFISNVSSLKSGTLAYATEMSIGGLLMSTNDRRLNNGKAALEVNQLLNRAAQAKADDMIARNYWSHNTPDGKEPWVFLENVGYDYLRAGENLAYGFATSNDTVTGWMNSPSHRANLLDGNFNEVGFGFANGNNYNSAGPETVVVAMYGKPQTLGASAAPSSQPTLQSQPPAPSPVPATQAAAQSPSPGEDITKTPVARPVNTDMPVLDSEGLQPLSRIQALTGGNVPWALLAAASLCGAAVTLLLIKHGLAARHLLINSEKLILKKLHQPLFDSVLLSLIILGYTLTRTVGFIG